MRNSNKFVYLKGSGRHFIRAPEWATIRVRTIHGDAWLEKREIGFRFIPVAHKDYSGLIIKHFPDPEYQEEIIAHRVSVYQEH
ncbi:TPA: hypothetical protein P2B70_003288 [Salmonella enterica subsp. enterica serovar Eastbourne]|nr:hypothetical protein [Salmonella enterica subsp. enterica serovar Eastbourne]HDN7573171.1 hypothetical protein [Salmonella enterica subsp. enterica serovar Eastbourne]